MSRRPLVLLAALIAVVASSLASPAGAEELPPGWEDLPSGFTDGIPVGSEEMQAHQEESLPPAKVSAAAPTQRYFGDGAYLAVRSAVASTTRSCSISNDGLTAMVLAPVFKESSAATTPELAPSPMTLSRADEWSGVMGDDSNANANHGLYAFRNPNTPYSRAYWHPGIGIWQYDSAGIGAGFTAIERMDVNVVAADVARTIATKYCAASGTLAQRRLTAWADWGTPCTQCEDFYQEMISTTPRLANLNLVPGISALGGVAQRTCTLDGRAGTIPCWYVNPSVGVIEGATWWATLDPSGGSPTAMPTPLSRPFYVLDLGATEERHWLRVDTGYDTDISASRTIGRNARPRSHQAGSGLTWRSTSGLCDLTMARGACMPEPPSGLSGLPVTVNSSNSPHSLDLNGDGLVDVFWYGVGTSADLLWMGKPGGGFTPKAISVTGTYDRILTGEITGDAYEDMILYSTDSGRAYLMRSRGDGTFDRIALAVGPGRRPFLIDTDGDGDREVFWYGPGSIPDSVWNWTGSGFSQTARVALGDFTPLVGDFDGNGLEDIFWYAPGAPMDKFWRHRADGGYSPSARQVAGTYQPAVGDFDGDGRDDIFWYAPGTVADIVWFGQPGPTLSPGAISLGGSYELLVADLEGDGRKDVIAFQRGSGGDVWLRWTSGRQLSSTPLAVPGRHSGHVGAFSAGGDDGVLWYQAGSTPDVIWHRG